MEVGALRAVGRLSASSNRHTQSDARSAKSPLPGSVLVAAEFCDDGEILKGRRVASDGLSAGDLLQESAHDLPGTRLRQHVREAYVVRLGNRTNDLADVGAEILSRRGEDSRLAQERPAVLRRKEKDRAYHAADSAPDSGLEDD